MDQQLSASPRIVEGGGIGVVRIRDRKDLLLVPVFDVLCEGDRMDYEPKKVLGRGSFGMVILYEGPDLPPLCLKHIHAGDKRDDEDDVRMARALGNALGCIPAQVLLEAKRSGSPGDPLTWSVVAMRVADGTLLDFDDYRTNTPVSGVFDIVAGVARRAQALMQTHEAVCVDCKLSNLLYIDQKVFFGDLGSMCFAGDVDKDSPGTFPVPWRDRECCIADEVTAVWGCVALVFQLLSLRLKPPFAECAWQYLTYESAKVTGSTASGLRKTLVSIALAKLHPEVSLARDFLFNVLDFRKGEIHTQDFGFERLWRSLQTVAR